MYHGAIRLPVPPVLTDPMSTRSLRQRLIAGFGANTFSRLSTTLTQIFSVPVFLSHWGVHLYGEWILLNTIPSYLGLSDVGFGSVAGNEMTMLAAAQNFDQALVVFQSVWVLTTFISGALGLLLISAVWFLPLDTWLHMHAISAADARLIVLLLGLAVLLGMQETLFHAAFRCVGKYPLGTMAKSLILLVAFLSTMVGVAMHLSPVPVAALYMAVNALGTGALWLLLRHEVPWIRFGIRHAQRGVIRRLTGPALSFMSFPLVNALNLQGILVVVGYVMGPIAVVTFNTARTISRSAAQGMNLINNSIWPEMSAAFGTGAMDVARMLHRRACQISLLLCLSITLGVAFLGDWIWKIWTVGKVPTDPVLLNIMLLQMVVSAFWFTSSVVPMATNQHQRMARAMLVATCLALVLAWLLMRVTALGLRGAAIALVAGDVFTAFYVLRESLRLLDDNLGDFARSMVDLSLLPRLWRRPKLPLANEE
jgi:O-antigen/teichoic acid export membrane protein